MSFILNVPEEAAFQEHEEPGVLSEKQPQIK